MSNYDISTLKIKQQDGTFKEYYPVTNLDAVVIDDNSGKKLSSILTNNATVFLGTASKANAVPWSGVQNKPTTLAGYGITDTYTSTQVDEKFIAKGEATTSPTANKLLKLDANAKIPATILNGVIPIENMPHGALERCVVVANDSARFALTSTMVQTGDTVKVTGTGKMYFVIDDTKLSTEAGYEVYTAGSATNVPWSGVQNKPITLAGYGITDAINNTDVVTTATANKILKLNSSGVLPASITGNSATATKLANARTISLAGDITGSGSFDGSGDLSITATIKDDSHNHIISNVDGLQNALNAKVNSSDVSAVPVANKLLKLDSSGVFPSAAIPKSIEFISYTIDDIA